MPKKMAKERNYQKNSMRQKTAPLHHGGTLLHNLKKPITQIYSYQLLGKFYYNFAAEPL